MINDAIKKSAGYKYYKHKKNEIEKGKVVGEPEEKHVSLVRGGRDKGYMRSGNQEVNVPKAFKKNVVPKKARYLTIADNIVEESVAVELAKSMLKTRMLNGVKNSKGPAIEDPAIQSLLDLRKGSKANRPEFEARKANTDKEKDDETDDFDDSDMDLSADEPQGDDDATGF
uniref:Uncharacterized protein n=1 Tax=Tanacetum cinerariifolium TaxID=118510 RepID=A0A6L2JZQ6_TANCI|nr:hypothetical protein [Tanacetum cinerariifolium]